MQRSQYKGERSYSWLNNFFEPYMQIKAALKYDERVVQSAEGVTGKEDTLNFSPQKTLPFCTLWAQFING